MRISVIVPVLNEAARIAAHLAALGALEGVDEVVVVDGGLFRVSARGGVSRG